MQKYVHFAFKIKENLSVNILILNSSGCLGLVGVSSNQKLKSIKDLFMSKY